MAALTLVLVVLCVLMLIHLHARIDRLVSTSKDVESKRVGSIAEIVRSELEKAHEIEDAATITGECPQGLAEYDDDPTDASTWTAKIRRGDDHQLTVGEGIVDLEIRCVAGMCHDISFMVDGCEYTWTSFYAAGVTAGPITVSGKSIQAFADGDVELRIQVMGVRS